MSVCGPGVDLSRPTSHDLDLSSTHMYYTIDLCSVGYDSEWNGCDWAYRQQGENESVSKLIKKFTK